MSERDETLARPGVDEPDVLVVEDGPDDGEPPGLLDEPADTGEVDAPVTPEVSEPVIDVVDTENGPVVTPVTAEPVTEKDPIADDGVADEPIADDVLTEEAAAETVAVEEVSIPESLPLAGPWAELQGRFVDDPSGCVREASDLVDEAIEALRSSLPGAADGDTESLRQAFRRYRAVHEALTRA